VYKLHKGADLGMDYQQNFGGGLPQQGLNYRGGAPGGAAQGGDFFNFNKVSPDMLNMAASAGQAGFDRMIYKVTPGMSSFWGSLKIYFAVSNEYVGRKLRLLLFPWRNKTWGRIPLDDGGRGTGGAMDSEGGYKWCPPRHDVNAPDLYVPMMAFITYVLLVGYWKGTSGAFTPETLVRCVWCCLICQLLEVGAVKVGLNIMGAPTDVLDVVAYTGYKYIGLACTIPASLLLGKVLFVLFSFYVTIALGFFLLKTLAEATPKISYGPPRWMMISGFAGLEIVVSLMLAFL
jgi:hypothetical protein